MLNASDYFLLVVGEAPNDKPPSEEAEAEQHISGLVFAGAKLRTSHTQDDNGSPLLER